MIPLGYWTMAIAAGILCMSLKSASSHLDEPCSLGLCLNSIIVPIKHAFCDSDNRCKCHQGYVAITPHRCAEIQYPGKPCEHDNVCRYGDENSYCDKNRMHPICECKKSHVYDPKQKKCIPYVKKPKKSAPLFPITAVILIACIGIFCGCGIICHNFRRQPELSDGVRRSRAAGGSGGGANSIRVVAAAANNNHNSGNNARTTIAGSAVAATAAESGLHPPLLRSDSCSSSSKYDSVLYDDPPPRYEDAIKEYSDVMINLEPRSTTAPDTVVVAPKSSPI